MLTTTGFKNFGIELQGAQSSNECFVNDATVTILGGTALLANSLVPWTGMQTQLKNISTFDGTTGWQNVLLYLYNDSTSTGPSMNYSYSDIAPSQVALDFPSMIDSNGQPLSLFTFQSTSGTDTTLMSYT